MTVKKLLLLDGDIFAFQAASLSEYEHWFDDETVVLDSDFAQAKRIAKSNIETIRKHLHATDVVFCYSCPSKRYWRHDYLESYKGNRKGTRPPMALKELKEWLADEYEGTMFEGLEADDVMGILATNPEYQPKYDRKIIVSIDKDMQTIPAWIYNPDKDYQEWKQTETAANRFWLTQAIMGDTTDGYTGIVGMGEVAANSFLDTPYYYAPYEHTFKSGKRKGETETRYDKIESPYLHATLKSIAERAGQTAEDVKTQLHVARILRHGDYDFDTKEVTLPKLKDIQYDR